MPNSDFTAPKLSLAFAKIVANPTANSWSQVYNAGSFFAALSLTTANSEDDGTILPAAGKEIFNNLEAEFFSLEDKKLQTIKSAIEKSFAAIAPEIKADATLCYCKDNVLYLFIAGRGKIIMMRQGKSGVLLEKTNSDPEIATASGYLEHGDRILLQTDRFAQNITEKNLKQAFELELPNDIAESLSPHIHEKEDGGQAGIVIAYKGTARNIQSVQPEAAEEQAAELPDEPTEDAPLKQEVKRRFKVNIPFPQLTKIQKLAVGLGFLILILLAGSIGYTKTSQENSKSEQLYKQVSAEAQKNISDGRTMAKLNPLLAADSFGKAEKILKDNISKFKTGSTEQAELQALLNEVTEGLSSSAPVNKVTPKEISADENNILNIEKNNKVTAAAQDDSLIYLLNDKAVSSINKTSGAKKEIIENNSDWSAAAAMGVYQGNIYILDKKAGVLKYTAGSGGFGKTNYFKGTAPDMSKAVSMSIDGSIWILTSDGKVLKYTRGERDDFTLGGMKIQLNNPAKILTSLQIDNIYILDPGNARILKAGKSGVYQNEYSADIFKTAKDFEVAENEEKAFVLSANKIYEIEL